MDISRVVEHFLMSLLPWIVGVIVGGGLGAICGLILRFLFSSLPRGRWLLALFPWRTIVMGLLAVVWTPFIVARLGFGPTAGGVMVGLSVLLLGLVSIGGVLIEYWHPSPLIVRLIGVVRTLLTGAVVLAVGAGFVGGGGVGLVMIKGIRIFEYGMVWAGVGAVVGLLLIFDLVFGVPQAIAGYVAASRKAGDETGDEAA